MTLTGLESPNYQKESRTEEVVPWGRDWLGTNGVVVLPREGPPTSGVRVLSCHTFEIPLYLFLPLVYGVSLDSCEIFRCTFTNL